MMKQFRVYRVLRVAAAYIVAALLFYQLASSLMMGFL